MICFNFISLQIALCLCALIAVAVAAPTDSDTETFVYNERLNNGFAYSTLEAKPYKFVSTYPRTYVRPATLYEPGYASLEYPYFYAPAYVAPDSYYYYVPKAQSNWIIMDKNNAERTNAEINVTN